MRGVQAEDWGAVGQRHRAEDAECNRDVTVPARSEVGEGGMTLLLCGKSSLLKAVCKSNSGVERLERIGLGIVHTEHRQQVRQLQSLLHTILRFEEA